MGLCQGPSPPWQWLWLNVKYSWAPLFLDPFHLACACGSLCPLCCDCCSWGAAGQVFLWGEGSAPQLALPRPLCWLGRGLGGICWWLLVPDSMLFCLCPISTPHIRGERGASFTGHPHLILPTPPLNPTHSHPQKLSQNGWWEWLFRMMYTWACTLQLCFPADPESSMAVA